MANTENWKGPDGYYNELSLDDLEDVSGGRVKLTGYAAVFAALQILKSKGKDKEYAKAAITKGWNENCQYRTDFTDGTEEDLQKTMSFIDKSWDLIP